jgi:hypothetical protein
MSSECDMAQCSNADSERLATKRTSKWRLGVELPVGRFPESGHSMMCPTSRPQADVPNDRDESKSWHSVRCANPQPGGCRPWPLHVTVASALFTSEASQSASASIPSTGSAPYALAMPVSIVMAASINSTTSAFLRHRSRIWARAVSSRSILVVIGMADAFALGWDGNIFFNRRSTNIVR